MELWTNWKKGAAVDKETPESKDETLMSQQGDRGSCGCFLMCCPIGSPFRNRPIIRACSQTVRLRLTSSI